jgi:translation initiation factor IF-1
LLAGRLTIHLKEGWPGARVGQIKEKFLIASMVHMKLIRAVKVMPRCQKFEANTTNTTAGKREIRSVKILPGDLVYSTVNDHMD